MKTLILKTQQAIDSSLQWLIKRYPAKRLLLASVVGALVFGWVLGLLIGAGVFEGALQDKIRLTGEVSSLQKAQLKNQLKITELATLHSIDSQSLIEVAKIVAELETSLANAEIELQLYQTLMGEYRQEARPSVRKVQLFDTERGELAYRIIVQQGKVRQGKASQLKLQVMIKGAVSDQSTQFTLGEIDPAFISDKNAFSIKYFKLFEGEILLPQGFAPKEIITNIWADGQKRQHNEQSFPWEIELAL